MTHSAPRKETMRQYELTYLISDLVPESELNKVTGKVGGYIRDLGGDLIKEEIWGRRKLAFPIKKQEFATYVTVIFNLPSDKAKEFEKNILLTGKIIRHLMLVIVYGKEVLSLSKEDVAETEDIEEVVGGERSFEAVEGETEESKDLMAVRGEEESEENEEEAEVEEEKFEETITPEAKESKDEKKKPAKKAKVEDKVDEAKAVEEEVDIDEAPTTEENIGVGVSDESARSGLSESSDPTESVGKTKEPEVKEEKTEKPAKESAGKEKKAPKKAKKENEADRLTKLDEELDNILGEDL